MIRSLYGVVLQLHPTAFRQRLRDEMLSIFDEDGTRRLRFVLLADGRMEGADSSQWRICAGLRIRLPIKAHQRWPENQQTFTPYSKR